MKNIAILIFGFLFVLSNYAVELHPEEECFSMKTNLTSKVVKLQQQNSDLRFSNNYILNSRVPLLYGSIEAGRSNDTSGDNIGDFNQMQIIANGISNTSYQTALTLETQYNQIQSVFSAISSIDCTACSVSSTNCCDFTEILQAIGEVNDSVDTSVYALSVISNQLNSLEYTNFLLEHGFFSVTNLLSFSNKNLLDINTNLVKTGLLNFLPLLASEKNTYLMLGNQMRPSLRDWSSNTRTQTAFNPKVHGLLNSIYSMNYVHFLELSSLNNYFYDFSSIRYPILTNTVGAIHRDTTNFFSFFRGEIGVRGVLEDWTSEQADGTYHDFLTNHYINVVRGGSLSGYQAEKTNWFARIETLLASLVFLDSSNTNSYNEAAASFSNSISRVKDEFDNELEGVSSASSTQMELVSDIEKSMYESLQSFSKAFSSASLPSTVRLLYVHKTSGAKSLPSSDSVDVTVPVEGKLMDFIEIIRSCTTLCWVFFGLWFMFKFSVWTVKKIYMLIRYIIDFFNMVAGGK